MAQKIPLNRQKISEVTPTMGTDDNYVTDAEKANLHAPESDNQDLSGYALKTNVLELDNTTEFTPDANYEPATKKYVDNNAGGTPEGTAVLSTGETGGSKFLREDGDGTCSWQDAGGGHTQNTDTGTTENTFTVDSDSTTGKIIVDVALGAADLSLTLTNETLTSTSKTATLQNKTGTIALTSDVIALGETSATAYRGDRGKTAYEHSQSAHAATDADKTETVISESDAGEPSNSAKIPFTDEGTLANVSLASLKSLLQQHFDTIYAPL